MPKEEEQKDFKKILDSKKSVDIYKQYLIHLTPFQIKTFKDLCKYLETNDSGYLFNLNYSKPKNKKIFVVFLTKSQIKNVNKAKKSKEKFNLEISPNQLKKTCFSIISLNNRIEDFLKDRKATNYRYIPDDDYLKGNLKFPDPKQVFNFSLYSDLAKTIKKLNSKESLNIANLIDNIVKTNQSVALIYKINQEELEILIKAIIVLISILLNPTSKGNKKIKPSNNLI